MPALCIAVLLLASGTWVIQEWAIHKYLLHAAFTWLGKPAAAGCQAGRPQDATRLASFTAQK